MEGSGGTSRGTIFLAGSLCAAIFFGVGFAASSWQKKMIGPALQKPPDSIAPEDFQERYWRQYPVSRFELINEDWNTTERAMGYWPALEEAEKSGASRACVDHFIHDKVAGRWQRTLGLSSTGKRDMVYTCTGLPPELLDAIRESNRKQYNGTGPKRPVKFLG